MRIKARVRYIGRIEGDEGQWVGVEALESAIPAEAQGLDWNDGSKGGGALVTGLMPFKATRTHACASSLVLQAVVGCACRRRHVRLVDRHQPRGIAIFAPAVAQGASVDLERARGFWAAERTVCASRTGASPSQSLRVSRLRIDRDLVQIMYVL